MWRAGLVRWNPICHGSCDVAVIPPTNDKVVVVGVRGVNDGQIGWDDWWITWSCDPVGIGGLVGWLFLRPGITKPRPGKSGRRSGSRVLPMDLCDVGLELVAFRLGDSTCSNVARLVVAVDEAFAADVPAGAHPFFAPLRSVAGAFSSKVLLPEFTLLHQEFRDRFGVLGDAGILFVSSLPLFLLISPFPRPRGCDRQVFGIGFDEVVR